MDKPPPDERFDQLFEGWVAENASMLGAFWPEDEPQAQDLDVEPLVAGAVGGDRGQVVKATERWGGGEHGETSRESRLAMT